MDGYGEERRGPSNIHGCAGLDADASGSSSSAKGKQVSEMERGENEESLMKILIIHEVK